MATTYSLASRIPLPNTAGLSMPRIQLGLYLMSGSEASKAVTAALEAGYRAFDCAQMYHNEREAGSAILKYMQSTGLKREDIFYTTKLASNGTYDQARRSISKSVQTCGLGYVDLFLLHSPYGGPEARAASWRALEDAVEAGEVRIAGVSNYGTKHLTEDIKIEELMSSKTKLKPAVNQIEVHPFNTRENIRTACSKHKIVVEAYAPLARALKMKHPLIKQLSGQYRCTPAQLMVRWSLQHGLVPLPKSVNPARIKENAAVEKFEIEQADMQKMNDLDEYLVTDWDPVDCP